MNDEEQKYLAIVIVVFVVGTFAASALFSSSSYWEVKSGTNYIEVNSTRLDVDTTEDNYEDVLDADVNTQQSSIKLDDGDSKFPDYSGTCEVQVQVGLPVHMIRNAYGEWVKSEDDTPLRVYQKDVNGIVYEYEHHVYTVDVEIRTDGRVTYDKFLGWWGTCEGLPTGSPKEHSAQVNVYFGYEMSPWNISVGQTFENDTGTYQYTDAFYGIMSASILDIPEIGKVEGQAEEPTFLGQANADNTEGAAINMHNAVNYWDTVHGSDEEILGQIQGVPQEALFEVSAKVEPGLKVDYNWYGGIVDMTPVDNVVKYRVRIDTLQATGYTFVSGDQTTMSNATDYDPGPDIPGPLDWLFNPMDDLFGNLLYYGAMAFGIILVVWVVKDIAVAKVSN